MEEIGLLDYSLLLAIEAVGTPDQPVSDSNEGKFPLTNPSLNDSSYIDLADASRDALNRHRFYSTCGRYVYHIAIIDYLTEFNLTKKFESLYKVNIKNNKAEHVSAVNPNLYASRFVNFMSKEVIVNEDLK